MGEFEGGHGPGVETQEREITSSGLPERFDHRGIWFESRNADEQSSETINRLDATRKAPSVYDLLAIVRGEKEDIADQKNSFIGNKKKFNRSEQELDTIQNTLIDLAAGQGNHISDEDKAQVDKYLERQSNRWIFKSNQLDEDSVEKGIAEKNQQLFASLRESLFTPTSINRSRNDTDKLEKYANTYEVKDDELQRKEEKLFPEYEYKPDKASEVVAELGKKEDITYKDIDAFYAAALADVTGQRQAAEDSDEQGGEYAGWRDKITAVDYARGFNSQHVNDEDIREQHILVGILPDGQINVGSELTIKNPRAKYYSFSLSGDSQDPDEFGRHAENVDQFGNRQKDIQLAIKTIQMIKDGDSDFFDKLRSGDDEAVDAQVAIVRVIEKHRDFILNNYSFDVDEEFKISDEDTKSMATLSRIADRIQQDAKFGEDEDDDDED